jgi:2-polyprenyl-3-methyl-5-hydroxy-6-metoxy-1,4-benzoquinol methylase
MNIRKIYTTWYDKQRVKSVKSFIRHASGKNILDVGSGIGIFNDVFRDIGFINIFAVDLDKNSLKYNDADKKILHNLEEKLPFPDNFFDLCVASEIIEHLDNRLNLIKEIRRVLKPGKYLFLTTPNRYSLIAKFDKLIGRFTVNDWWNGHNYQHKYVYGFNEIIELIKNNGFKIVRVGSFYLFYGLPILTNTSLGMCTWILAKKNVD